MREIKDFTIEEIKAHPELIVSLFSNSDKERVSIHIKQHGEKIHVVKNTYSNRVEELLKICKEKADDPKYSKEQARKDFMNAQKVIGKKLSNQ